MINVVFLLLIFFMISARIEPAAPFELAVPNASEDTPLAIDRTLYLGLDGAVAFENASDEGAWAALAQGDPAAPLIVRADARMPAANLAGALARLGAMGITQVDLAVRAP